MIKGYIISMYDYKYTYYEEEAVAEQLVKQAEDQLDWPDAIAGQNCSDLWIDLFDLHLNMTNKQKKTLIIIHVNVALLERSVKTDDAISTSI
jgi:hypothetical protein